MADVFIHRCTLRIVRRGGRNWGPAPRRLVEEVLRLLPVLLARQLETLLPDSDEDQQIAAPVRLQLSVPASALTAEISRIPQAPTAIDSEVRHKVLEAKLESAVRRAFGLPTETGKSGLSLRREEKIVSGRERETRKCREQCSALHRLLLSWQEQGSLERRLHELPLDTIETWYHSLRPLARESESRVDALEADLGLLAMIRRRSAEGVIADRKSLLIFLIMLASEAATQRRIRLDDTILWQALDRAVPAEPSVTVAYVHRKGERRASSPRQPPMIASSRESPIPNLAICPANRRDVIELSENWETHVSCVLPFLLLSILDRIGYLETLAAVVETAKLEEQASLVAQALAYKVLDPPERGWRRSPKSMADAAAFAGLRLPAAEDEVAKVASHLTTHLSPLDVLLKDALIQGHNPEKPVLLRRAPWQQSPGFLLVETEGCFGICWESDVEPILAVLRRMGPPVVIVSPESVELDLMRRLHAESFSFVTYLPPSRGESWQRIQQGPLQFGWSNAPRSQQIVSAARQFEPACEHAEGLWNELAVKRPSVVHMSGAELNRTLTLAASTAAGMIAWKLWRERGPTTPQLVIERFCDLDARVRFANDAVHIDLPLGRRRQALFESELLRCVEDVPWLNGRRVEYGGG